MGVFFFFFFFFFLNCSNSEANELQSLYWSIIYIQGERYSVDQCGQVRLIILLEATFVVLFVCLVDISADYQS